jgi:hypothetical protein
MGATPDGRAWTRYVANRRGGVIGEWREVTTFTSGRPPAPSTSKSKAQPRINNRSRQNITLPNTFVAKTCNAARRNQYNAGRYFLECYMGKLLESWEVCRHGIAGPNDHSFANVSPGDAVNNMIDDLENGNSETNLTYLLQAKNRIDRLIANRLNTTK